MKQPNPISTKSLLQLDIYPEGESLQKFSSISDEFIILNDIRDMSLKYQETARVESTIISVCTNGYCRVNVNMQEYYISPGSMLFLFPDQHIQGLEISEDHKGVFISFSRSLADNVYYKIKVVPPLFLYTKEYPCISLTPSEVALLMDYYNMLWKKTRGEETFYSRDIVQGLLIAMLAEIYSIYRNRIPRKTEDQNRKEVLFDQFMRLLSHSYKKERRVAYYACQLFLTSKHLSSVVKDISGKTAGEWIDIFVIFEAKSLLKSSQKNIQEIAAELNFSNQSFFGKYFKHFTGISPKEYRQGKFSY